MTLRILAILVCGIALFTAQTTALAGNMPLPPNAIEFTRSEIQSGQYGQDLFQILSLVSTRAGITFKSSSDVGAEDWLLIRGFPRDSSRNVLVLFDGRPINTATSDAVEISDVPIDLTSVSSSIAHRFLLVLEAINQ